MANSNVVRLPTAKDIETAKKTSRVLSKYASKKLRLKICDDNNNEEDMILPGDTLDLLLNILTHMSQGNAISVMPIYAELTTQQAANLLNVSRPYLIGLLNKGDLKFKKVGTHRRILAKDIIKYKETENKLREQALQELTDQAQELGMGYD